MPKSVALKRAKSLIDGTETSDPPVTAAKASSTAETSAEEVTTPIPAESPGSSKKKESIETPSNFDVGSPENQKENVLTPKRNISPEENIVTSKPHLSLSKKPGPLSRKRKMVDKNIANISTNLTCSNPGDSNEKSRTTTEINFTKKSCKELLSSEDSGS